MNNNLSLCITTYNRPEKTIQAFVQIIGHPRINEIVIVDDHSNEDQWERLKLLCADFPAVRLFRNEKNLGMHRNKREAIEKASSAWCILFDSDNVITAQYIDAIPEKLIQFCLYLPSFARPRFDYRDFASAFYMYHAFSVVDQMDNAMFRCALNTCNWVCNREAYLDIWKDDDVDAADTISFVYRWLKTGGAFRIVPNMEYDHLVHDDSGFMKNIHRNMADAKKYEDLIRNLSKV